LIISSVIFKFRRKATGQL